jgi:apolipoprotein N-acyltransferase
VLRQSVTNRLPLTAALLSGLILGLAFPPVGQSDAAWFALVPLLLALRQATPRGGFRLGWCAGFVFWLGNLAWLWRLIDNGGPLPLVLLGHGALAAYCALYAGLFGLAVAWLWRQERIRNHPWLRVLMTVVVAPLLWAGSEWFRGTLLTGFAWNALGISQYRNLALIQGAAWGGMSLVSALLVAVNGGIACFLERLWSEVVVARRRRPAAGGEVRPRRFAPRATELTLALLLVVVCWSHGLDHVRTLDRAIRAAPVWKLALLHPEAPSIFQQNDGTWEAAMELQRSYAELAGAVGPDLCLWPETSLPGAGPLDADTVELATNITALAASPLLAGGLEIEPGPGWEWQIGARYYNAAFLFDTRGRAVATYRKQHLVPFGEFIPLDRRFPWLARLSPIGYSCTPGASSGIMTLAPKGHDGRAPLRLAPLICFEDTLPHLARRAARDGATLLANLTNDAWFDGSSEAEQHLAQAVFRCVETGLPMVRSSNRGVTCAILPNGRVVQRIGQGDGAGTPGILFAAPGVPPQPATTPFVRHGHLLLAWPGAALLLTVLLLAALDAWRKRHRPASARDGASRSGVSTG